jgi:hypothetical protein
MAKGLYSNAELIDVIVADCNNAVGAIFSGNNIKFCKIMYEIVVKLVNLKNGIKSDMENKDMNIEHLKGLLHNLGHDVVEATPAEIMSEAERDGADDGNDTN